MLVFLKFLAIVSAALFAGAALYINVAEQPARMTLETRFAAAQWAPSYQRAAWLQAPLALLSLLCGFLSWLLGGGLGWLRAVALNPGDIFFAEIGCEHVAHPRGEARILVVEKEGSD
jgi:hypothetical protein